MDPEDKPNEKFLAQHIQHKTDKNTTGSRCGRVSTVSIYTCALNVFFSGTDTCYLQHASKKKEKETSLL